jgi:hypothetical protein
VTPQGGAPFTRDLVVEPDPRFQITQTDRTAHHAAVMSAYTLQEQLGAARDAAQALSLQVAPLRQYLAGAGESAKVPLETLEKVGPEVARTQAEIGRALQAASRVESAIDSYPGLPTAAQARELEWAWEDAAKAVTELNRVLRDEMAGVYSALTQGGEWKQIQPVTVPERTK